MVETNKEPIFGNVPSLVLGLCAAILGTSLLALYGPVPLSNWVMGVAAVQIGPEHITRPFGPLPPYVLHVFVHGSLLHLGMNTLGLLAFGSPIARWLVANSTRQRGVLAFFLVFFVSAAAGALAESAAIALRQAQGAILVGASGGLMGLIGVLIRLEYGRRAKLLPLFSRTVLIALIPWVVLNLLIAVFGMPGTSGNVAWVAHLGGLCAGLVLAGVVAPRR